MPEYEKMLYFIEIHSVEGTRTYFEDGDIWGNGYEWETGIPVVNPISYSMMGSLPQMHRNELTISKTVSLLMKKAYVLNTMQLMFPALICGNN